MNQEYISSLEKQAEQGDSSSILELGKCYLYERGVTYDADKAYELFVKAADKDNEIAKMYMGHCQMYGIGVEKDEYNAYTLLDNALNYNYPDEGESQMQAGYSQFEKEDLCQLFLDLGDALENGLGVYKNYKIAVYYFSMLKDWGQPIGAERLSHYKKRFGFWKKID